VFLSPCLTLPSHAPFDCTCYFAPRRSPYRAIYPFYFFFVFALSPAGNYGLPSTPCSRTSTCLTFRPSRGDYLWTILRSSTLTSLTRKSSLGWTGVWRSLLVRVHTRSFKPPKNPPSPCITLSHSPTRIVKAASLTEFAISPLFSHRLKWHRVRRRGGVFVHLTGGPLVTAVHRRVLSSLQHAFGFVPKVLGPVLRTP